MKKSIAFISTTLLATLLSAEQIKRIDFVNLSMMSSKIAAEAVDMNSGDDFDIQKVNKAIKKFFKYGYFKDVIAKNNDGVLEFHFKEKPTVANLTMHGYKTREDDIDAMFNVIGIRKGSLHTEKALEKAKKALHKQLENEGYVNSVIEIETEEINENSVALIFSVNKGEEIIIKKANYFGVKNIKISEFEKITVNNEIDILPWFFGQNSGEANIAQLPHERPRIADVYYQHGYLDSEVKKPFLKVDFSSNEAELNYFIKEGSQYKANDIVIYLDSKILDPKKLYPKLKIKKNRVFNIQNLRKDIEYIKTEVADLGYAFAIVKYDLKKDKKNSKVDIIFNVIPGKKVYINDVFISGNARTLDRVIRRHVYMAPGDLFSLSDFTDSKNKLNRSGLFETVDISKKRVSDTEMDLIVKVKEAPTSSLTLGGGFGSYDGMSINAGINDKNIFGSGKTLGFDIDTSERKLDFRVFVKEPAVNDSKYSAEIDIHSRDTEIVRTTNNYTLDKKVIGFMAGVGTELSRNTRFGANYKLDQITEEYTDDDTTDSYDPFLYRSNEDYILSSLTPYIKYNSTDNYNFPTSGIKARTSLEYAGIGGDAKFIKSLSEFSYYHSLQETFEMDWVFKYKTKLSYLVDTGKISPGDSFYLGGPRSLRGYKSFAFGPDDDSTDPALKQSISNSLEMTIPLFSEKTRIGFFYDYGMIGESSFTEIKRSSAGALFQWLSPMGPIQFIFAEALDSEPDDDLSSFEFQLGASF